MKILKLLVHPLVVLVVIIAIAIYFNRADLLSTIEKFKASHETSSEQQTAMVESGESESTAKQDVQPAEVDEKNVIEKPEPAEAAVAIIAADDGNKEQPVEDAHDGGSTQPVIVSDEQIISKQDDSITTDMTEEPVVAESSEQQQAYGETLETVPDTPSDDAAGSAPMSAEALQQMSFEARRAAYQGNFVEAEKNYQIIIESQPHNYDAYGALGDIYMKMGSVDKAVEAYSNATELLFKSNRKNMAWRVLNYIGRISPEKARELHSRLYER